MALPWVGWCWLARVRTVPSHPAPAHGQIGPLPPGAVRQPVDDLQIATGLDAPCIRLRLTARLRRLAGGAGGVGGRFADRDAEGPRVAARDVADGCLAEVGSEGGEVAGDHRYAHRHRLEQ